MSKVLFFTHHPAEAAGTRYRINQFLPALESAGYQCTVWPFSTAKLFRSLNERGRLTTKIPQTLYCTGRRLLQLSQISRFDIIVIHREVFPFLIPMMENFVLSRRPKVIFDFDDAVYGGHPDRSTLNHSILYRFKYGRGIDDVIRKSAHVVAGNRVLADYARALNPNVSVIPTVVDCDSYPCASRETHDAKITIGWMGSRSTAPYLKTIEPVLRRIAEENREKVRFRFYGFAEYQLDLPDFLSRPFNLATEIEDLCSIDIGLMPLPDTDWTRGKCAFKAIQYMAVGAVPIASPVGITQDIVRSGINGFLARSPKDWYRALQLLIDDVAMRQRLSSSARSTVEDKYSLKAWVPQWLAIIAQCSRTSASQRDISSFAIP